MVLTTTTLTTLLFYIFAALLVIAAARVVTAPNAVQSALFLVLTFFSAAALWILLKAEFLAIVLVLVYVGAVMVLFLFVVMMANMNSENLREEFARFLPWAMIVGGIVVIELALIIWHYYSNTVEMPEYLSHADMTAHVSNTQAIGKLLYTKYIFAFEMAGLILLIAIVAAVGITVRKRQGIKRNDPDKQVKVIASERFQLLDVDTENDAPDAYVPARNQTQHTQTQIVSASTHSQEADKTNS